MRRAAFLWGVAEATLFFIVPDVLLSFIGLKRGARDAATAALASAVGAGVGGAIMHAWSAHDAETARAVVLAVPAISEAMAARAEAAMAANWFLATFLGPLSATPFKVYAMLAPQAGTGLVAFALLGVVVRLPRFLVSALGAVLLRRWLEPRLGRRALAWALVAGWVVFYAAFFALMPG